MKRAVKTVVASRGVGIPEVKAAFALLKLTGGVARGNRCLGRGPREIEDLI